MCGEKKICISCGEIKTMDNFYLRTDTNSYRNQCKTCLKNKTKRDGISSRDNCGKNMIKGILERYDNGLIKCKNCRLNKSVNNFTEDTSNKIIKYNHICDECDIINQNKLIKEHKECVDRWLGYETEIHKVIEYVGYFKRNNEKYPRRWFKYQCKFCENIETVQVNRLLKLKDMTTCRLCKCVYKKKENLKKCSGCSEWKVYNDDNFNIFPSNVKHGKRLQPECRPCRLKTSKKTREKMEKSGKGKEYRDSVKPRVNNKRKKRYATDEMFRLKVNIRNSINQAFKIHRFNKLSDANELLCCNWPTLKKHLEEQFTEGMSWDLMGKEIHIDHKIPLSSAKTIEDLSRLFHYTNLQPLWGKYNLMKNGKILTDEEIDKLRSLPKPE